MISRPSGPYISTQNGTASYRHRADQIPHFVVVMYSGADTAYRRTDQMPNFMTVSSRADTTYRRTYQIHHFHDHFCISG